MIDSIVALPDSPTAISVFSASKDNPIIGIEVVLVKYLFCPSMALFVAFSLFLLTDMGMNLPFCSGRTPFLFALVKNLTKKRYIFASTLMTRALVVSLLNMIRLRQ